VRRAGIAVACILILLGLVESAGLVGRLLALAVAVVAAAALIVALLLPWRGWVSYLALSCALLGSAIGVASAIQAFAAVGANADYRARLPFGAAALMLALAAGGAGVAAGRYPARGAALMVLAGLAGVVAINLYDINTAYDFAVPFWLLGALLSLVRSLRPDAAAGQSIGVHRDV
jgi:hypothetical protein